MTEAITAAVARLGATRVLSRTSAMQFKRDRPPLPEIARRLGADALVEGSVLRARDRVRVTARLIDARTDELLWSDTQDRDLKDVLALQDDVARAIVAGIHGRLSAAEPPQASAAAAPGTARQRCASCARSRLGPMCGRTTWRWYTWGWATTAPRSTHWSGRSRRAGTG